MTVTQHRPSGMGVFVVVALGHAAAIAYWRTATLAYRVRQLRPICALLGHTFDPDLIDCVRCGTTYNRVRDCGRPR